MTLDQLLSKAFNGKAENIVISKNIIMFHLDGVETRINLVSFIDQIYNDHETAIKTLMKANEEEISRHFNELKAKDEITQDIIEAYELKSIAYDLLLEAIKLKDEEIERVKEAMQEFVNRCEKGEAIRSRNTYYKFKELLKDKK